MPSRVGCFEKSTADLTCRDDSTLPLTPFPAGEEEFSERIEGENEEGWGREEERGREPERVVGEAVLLVHLLARDLHVGIKGL